MTVFCSSTIRVPIPRSSNLLESFSGVVPSAPIIIGMTFVRMFHNFCTSRARSLQRVYHAPCQLRINQLEFSDRNQSKPYKALSEKGNSSNMLCKSWSPQSTAFQETKSFMLRRHS